MVESPNMLATKHKTKSVVLISLLVTLWVCWRWRKPLLEPSVMPGVRRDEHTTPNPAVKPPRTLLSSSDPSHHLGQHTP